MSVQPDLVGAIGLTSGSNIFSWTGPSLTAGKIKPGDEIRLPGKAMVLTIGGTEGDITAAGGLLTDNCPAAAAGAGQVARIRYQPDLSRAPAQMTALIELLNSGNVYSLAGLNGAGGDKGVHLTGAGVMATHTLTALGRALAGLTGVSGKFPVATGAGSAELRDIVGSVGIAGGVPTGAIIERGSNANGEYVRFADGTQICWARVNVPYLDVNRLYTVWSFPASMQEVRCVLGTLPYLTADYTGVSAQSTLILSSTTSSPSATGIACWARGGVPFSAGNEVRNVSVIAIGRWF